MADRPTELELMLDAIDETFKSAIGQFAKNAAVALQQSSASEQQQFTEIKRDIALVCRARNTMVDIVKGKL
jgi:hypothetical protein